MNETPPKIELTPTQIAVLQQRAAAAAENSYSPYSHFRVGAAILLEDGAIVTGCNVENASYRLTTCAEQTAIASAIAQHGPSIRIRAVAVANLNDEACQPCGACRQTIAEFASADTRIFFPNADGTSTELTMTQLLPAAFVLKQ
jgi:cytidine deaminase